MIEDLRWIKVIKRAKLLKYFKANVTIKAVTDIYLPAYKGSALRGAFGNQFKKLTCILKNIDDCSECPVRRSCFYYKVFESRNGEDKQPLKSGETIPHPYILLPPLDDKPHYKPGSKSRFSILLLGKYIEAVPFFFLTFERMGKRGIGKDSGKFEIDSISVNGKKITSNFAKLPILEKWFYISSQKRGYKGKLQIVFVTPLRVKSNGRLLETINTFFDLLHPMIRRVEQLSYYYGEQNLTDVVDLKDIFGVAKNISVEESSIYWYRWERYSNRQKRRISLSGIKGAVTLSGDFTELLWLFKFAELFHIGKNTSFGLGKIRVKFEE